MNTFCRLSVFFERRCVKFLVLLILCDGTFLILRLLSTKILTLLYQNSTIYCLTLANQPISSCHIDVWRWSRVIVKIVSKCTIRSFLYWRILILQLLLLFFSKSCFVCLRFDRIADIFICKMSVLSSTRFVYTISWHRDLLVIIIVVGYC